MTRARVSRGLIAALLPMLAATCAQAPKVDYPATPVPFTDVHLTDVFWAPRLETNRTVTIPHIFKENEDTGRVKNFELAEAAPSRGSGREVLHPLPFDDSDVYKIIEAASYAVATHADPSSRNTSMG